VLTGAVCRAGKRSLIVWCAVSGQVPCSGAKRWDKVLDEVSTAVLGDAVAENQQSSPVPRFLRYPCEAFCSSEQKASSNFKYNQKGQL
jgi:hypothetical protein